MEKPVEQALLEVALDRRCCVVGVSANDEDDERLDDKEPQRHGQQCRRGRHVAIAHPGGQCPPLRVPGAAQPHGEKREQGREGEHLEHADRTDEQERRVETPTYCRWGQPDDPLVRAQFVHRHHFFQHHGQSRSYSLSPRLLERRPPACLAYTITGRPSRRPCNELGATQITRLISGVVQARHIRLVHHRSRSRSPAPTCS